MSLDGLFACSCGPENKAQCEKRMAWALEFLKATPENFISGCVYYLNGSYNASCTGIPSDQWAAVCFDRGDRVETPFQTYVQCDRVEDGFALTLETWVNKFGTDPVLDWIEKEA